MSNMIHYIFLKDILDKIPSEYKKKLEYNNDIIYNASTFLDLPRYFNQFRLLRRDKYNIYTKFHSDDFYLFFKRCLIDLNINQNLNSLLYIYAMISHFILDSHLEQFLIPKVNKKNNYDLLIKQLDYYVAYTKIGIDLTNTKLTNYFKEGFKYPSYLDKLIHNSLVREFNFFSSYNYFTKASKKRYFFYRRMTCSRFKIKKTIFKIVDKMVVVKSKIRPNSYVYSNKVDTTLLNLTHKPYLVGDVTYRYSFTDVLDNAKKETLVYINAINEYLFYNKSKNIKELLENKLNMKIEDEF